MLDFSRNSQYDPVSEIKSVLSGFARVDLSPGSDPSSATVDVTPYDSEKTYRFEAHLGAIVRHVESLGESPLTRTTDENDFQGQWRLFSVHVDEAIATADASARHLRLTSYGVEAV